MEFRSQTKIGVKLTLFVVLLSGLAAADEVKFDVRHGHLRGGGTGHLIATADGLAFEESTGKSQHSWRTKWQDVQQLWVGMSEIRVRTYADSRWRLGADREYTLTASPGTTFVSLYTLASDRLDGRLVAAISSDVEQVLWELPVKRKRGFGGSEGILQIGADAIVYRSDEKDESRSWRISDIDNVSTAGPFDLTITTFESGQSYTFQLKQRLDEPRYQALWRRLNEQKQLGILR